MLLIAKGLDTFPFVAACKSFETRASLDSLSTIGNHVKECCWAALFAADWGTAQRAHIFQSSHTVCLWVRPPEKTYALSVADSGHILIFSCKYRNYVSQAYTLIKHEIKSF